MTGQQKKNRVSAAVILFLFITSIVVTFPLDQLLVGAALFCLAVIILVIKIIWSVSVWADETVQRWSVRNLAPKDGFDVTLRVEDDETKQENL
jgi:hypothetical protein